MIVVASGVSQLSANAPRMTEKGMSKVRQSYSFLSIAQSPMTSFSITSLIQWWAKPPMNHTSVCSPRLARA